nr:hypothetical protein [Tanacetum cinerariifolium]
MVEPTLFRGQVLNATTTLTRSGYVGILAEAISLPCEIDRSGKVLITLEYWVFVSNVYAYGELEYSIHNDLDHQLERLRMVELISS